MRTPAGGREGAGNVTNPIDPLEAARAERNAIAVAPARTTTPQRDERHARYQRLAQARADLTAALRAFDDGQGGEPTWAPLEVALDRLRAAARACR